MGAVLENQKRMDVIRQIIKKHGGNYRVEVFVKHRTVNDTDYQRLILNDLNISDKDMPNVLSELSTTFKTDLRRLEPNSDGSLTLVFRYKIPLTYDPK